MKSPVSLTVYDSPRAPREGVVPEQISPDVYRQFQRFAGELYNELLQTPLGSLLSYIKISPRCHPGGLLMLLLGSESEYPIDLTVGFEYTVLPGRSPTVIEIPLKSSAGSYPELFVKAKGEVREQVLLTKEHIAQEVSTHAGNLVISWGRLQSMAKLK